MQFFAASLFIAALAMVTGVQAECRIQTPGSEHFNAGNCGGPISTYCGAAETGGYSVLCCSGACP